MHVIDPSGGRTRAPSVGEIELVHGSWLTGTETSGGGYGDPLDRDPAHVLEDVLEHYVSPGHACDVYGVVFTGNIDDGSLALDPAATEARRAELASAR